MSANKPLALAMVKKGIISRWQEGESLELASKMKANLINLKYIYVIQHMYILILTYF